MGNLVDPPGWLTKIANLSAKFEGDGTKLVGGSPEQMMETIRADVIRWRRVVETANIKIE